MQKENQDWKNIASYKYDN